MIDDATRDAVNRLVTSRMAPFDDALKSEIGTVVADLSDRGHLQSSLGVTYIYSAGESNLADRAKVIAETIKEVCEVRNVGPVPSLANELKGLFDVVYQNQVATVQDRVEKTVPAERKKLCPNCQVEPDVSRYREELSLFAEGLPPKDYWARIVVWFRGRWWSVPFVAVIVCVPAMLQWVKMLKTLLRWMSVID